MKINAQNYNSGELLKFIREWTELSQGEFAKTVNVSESTIKNYEQNRRSCTLKTFLEFCKTHDIDVIIEKKDKKK